MKLKNLARAFRCALRLKCPKCERGPLFRRRFSTFARCPECGLKFEREPGYFVGAMYLNYGATVCIAFPGFFLLEVFTTIPFAINLGGWGLFSALFPVLFYRYSRSLWLSFDYMFNPK